MPKNKSAAKPENESEEIDEDLNELTASPELGAKPMESEMEDEKLIHPSLEKKSALLSHMDSIRGLTYLDKDQLLASVSEDCLVKLWNLKEIRQNWQSESIEPFLTLRGHTAPLIAICQSNGTAKERLIYTAGAEGHIRVWDIPDPSKVVPYGPTDGKNYCVGLWKAHEEPVWQLAAHPTNVYLFPPNMCRITYCQSAQMQRSRCGRF